jgi:hypothetical protein
VCVSLARRSARSRRPATWGRAGCRSLLPPVTSRCPLSRCRRGTRTHLAHSSPNPAVSQGSCVVHQEGDERPMQSPSSPPISARLRRRRVPSSRRWRRWIKQNRPPTQQSSSRRRPAAEPQSSASSSPAPAERTTVPPTILLPPLAFAGRTSASVRPSPAPQVRVSLRYAADFVWLRRTVVTSRFNFADLDLSVQPEELDVT